MPKVIISGRGGSGKSTFTSILARVMGQTNKVLVVDTDESNLGLGKMMGLEPAPMSLMACLGGRSGVREKLLSKEDRQKTGKGTLFAENLTLSSLPVECTSWDKAVGLLRIGKIEHSHEGCACLMGTVARSLINQLQLEEDEWMLVDTEAGVEHFGRGVMEGADMVLMVVDPSHEAVLLAERGKALAQEAGKQFFAVLNKVDEATEPLLREELAGRGVEILGRLGHHALISRDNLLGRPLDVTALRGNAADLANELDRKLKLNSGPEKYRGWEY